MVLNNGWHDIKEKPVKPGNYDVITLCTVKDPFQNLDLVVRDGDLTLETDFYNGEDWVNNPASLSDQDHWKIVAWKEHIFPVLPDAYKYAVTLENFPKRKTFAQELGLDDAPKNLTLNGFL